MINYLLALFFLAADGLPTGETVLAHYVEATGGRAAYDKIRGHIEKGSMALPAQNIKGAMTMYQSEPDKQVVVIDFPGIGKAEEGTDGKIAWSASAMQGARLKEGEEKAAALRSAMGDAKFLDWKKNYKSVVTAGVEDVEGKPCYRVVMTPLTGKPETEYYEKESGLLVRQTATAVTPMGEIAVDARVSDYRKEGGILMPHKLKQTLAGQSIEITVDSVEINPEFPKDRFEPPAEVKALIK
jgi:zinc protease